MKKMDRFCKYWLGNPNVAVLGPEARCVLFGLIVVMQKKKTGTVTGTPQELAQLTRTLKKEFERALKKISEKNAAIVEKVGSEYKITLPDFDSIRW